MDPQTGIELVTLLWPLAGRGEYVSTDGRPVTVMQAGEYNPESGRFEGAEIIFGTNIYRGTVTVWAGNNTAPPATASDILQITPFPSSFSLGTDGNPIPQIILDIDPVIITAYQTIRTGNGPEVCAATIHSMGDHGRIGLFTRLAVDRLNRKCRDLYRIHEDCNSDWNQTMYVMLMRTMGDARNKECFTELARRVRYSMVSRERNDIRTVEALLLGTSGLLELYPHDSYITELKADFAYLRSKYNIEPIMPGAWDISRTNPNNHPVIRIVQMAAFLSTREFLFDNIIACRTVNEVHSLFRAEASQYWSTHYIPSRTSAEQPKRIGHFKANIMAINLVVTLMFAYGDSLSDQEMKDRAMELLEKINCEDNRIVNSWREKGVVMENAFDSQAILQLNNEFCLKGLCWLCPVGRRIIKKYMAPAAY